MKTFGIIILIPIIFAFEMILSIATLTLYLFMACEYGGLMTKRLIDKLD